MSDNTTLPTASGGDVIRTEVVSEDYAGNQVKVQLVKLLKGRGRLAPPGGSPTIGVDGGVVEEGNPLPVADASCRRLLEEILLLEAESLEVLQEIRDGIVSRGAAARKPILGR